MAGTPAEFFSALADRVDKDKIKGMNATYQWDITGDNGGKWHAKIADGNIEVGEGQAESPNLTITVSDENWMDIIGGSLNPQMAFMTGKLKIQGDMSLAMKLQTLTG
jgi:putative sterol carrier protein